MTSGQCLIVGYGVTGRAVAAYLSAANKHYQAVDDGLPTEADPALISIEQAMTALAQRQFGWVMPSPGIAPTHQILRRARECQIPLVSEFDLAAPHLKGRLIGVTGTNGKSTVASLIFHLLQSAGVSSALKGNIGDPLATAVLESPKQWYVIEESSFQTEQSHLHHHIALCLNVTDDHFERYASIAEYAEAKACMLRGMTAADTFIYNLDDEWCCRMAATTTAQTLSFSLNQSSANAYFRDNELIMSLPNVRLALPAKKLSLSASNQILNAMASLLAVLTIDATPEAIQKYQLGFDTFRQLPHRMQVIATIDGVTFIDDSKATNVGAVVTALSGMTQPVILFLGGRDKGGRYEPLVNAMQPVVKHAFLYGESRFLIERAVNGSVPVTVCETLRDAVQKSADYVTRGDVVMLSPACSSFDQYKNYHERGLAFGRLVNETYKDRRVNV